jgi:SAM-dependent methyltransferase
LAGRIRCQVCGVSTTVPVPSDAELDHAYGGGYRPDRGRFGAGGDSFLRRTRSSLARRLDRIAPPGPVLDVGAGDGTLLDAVRARGRDALGLERTGERPDILAAELTDLDGPFAAIVFWHSLEHLREPAAALDQAAGLLTRRGVLVVAVPNSKSLQARVFGDRWFALDPPRHLVHLTSGALRGKLTALGLHVDRVSYLRGGQVLFGWLDGMVAHLPGSPSLYDAIRHPEARSDPLSRRRRLAALLAAFILLPAALAAAAIEVVLRRGGTVYVEARAA